MRVEMTFFVVIFIVVVGLVFLTSSRMERECLETGVPGSIIHLPIDVPCETLGSPIKTPRALCLQTVMFQRHKELIFRQIWVKDERTIPQGKFIIKKSDNPMDMGIKVVSLSAD